MRSGHRIILIAGSSHVGKTTLATRLADAIGSKMISTDRLARHPGRPWPTIPEPVADFYRQLPNETIYWFLRVHHENMWAGIRRMIEDHARAEDCLILEGSALRPEYVAPLFSDVVTGVCLHAPEAFLRERMRSEAGYDDAAKADQAVMDKFIERSLRDNAEMRAAAKRHGLALVDVSAHGAVEGLHQSLADGLL